MSYRFIVLAALLGVCLAPIMGGGRAGPGVTEAKRWLLRAAVMKWRRSPLHSIRPGSVSTTDPRVRVSARRARAKLTAKESKML